MYITLAVLFVLVLFIPPVCVLIVTYQMTVGEN